MFTGRRISSVSPLFCKVTKIILKLQNLEVVVGWQRPDWVGFLMTAACVEHNYYFFLPQKGVLADSFPLEEMNSGNSAIQKSSDP